MGYYRYGFNGKEKDVDGEWGENTTNYDFGARIYNPSIGKWLSTDPLQVNYTAYSPYNYSANSPIWLYDPSGMSVDTTIFVSNNGDYLGQTNDQLDNSVVVVNDVNSFKKNYKGADGNSVNDVEVLRNTGLNYKLADFDAMYQYMKDNPVGPDNNFRVKTSSGEIKSYFSEFMSSFSIDGNTVCQDGFICQNDPKGNISRYSDSYVSVHTHPEDLNNGGSAQESTKGPFGLQWSTIGGNHNDNGPSYLDKRQARGAPSKLFNVAISEKYMHFFRSPDGKSIQSFKIKRKSIGYE